MRIRRHITGRRASIEGIARVKSGKSICAFGSGFGLAEKNLMAYIAICYNINERSVNKYFVSKSFKRGMVYEKGKNKEADRQHVSGCVYGGWNDFCGAKGGQGCRCAVDV